MDTVSLFWKYESCFLLIPPNVQHTHSPTPATGEACSLHTLVHYWGLLPQNKGLAQTWWVTVSRLLCGISLQSKNTRVRDYDWLHLTAEEPQCRISSQKVYYCISKLQQGIEVGAVFIIISCLIGFVMLWVMFNMTPCSKEDLYCHYHPAHFGRVQRSDFVLQTKVMNEAQA